VTVFSVYLALAIAGFLFFKQKARGLTGHINSLPADHGKLAAYSVLCAGFIFTILGYLIGNHFLMYGGFFVGFILLIVQFIKTNADFRARHHFERGVKLILMLSAGVAVLVTIGIVASLFFETFRFFGKINVFDFLFGTHWSPSAPDVSKSLGLIPLLVGTLLITAIALSVATPIGLMSAIYLAEYATPTFRKIAKPILEILAGIPTVVLGFFAALTVAPFLRNTGATFGLNIAAESALAAGLVMGMMIIPFVSSLADDVINAVPQTLRDGSLAMGATPSETIRRVVLPAALPGIVSAFMLALSRAIGETMIVVMAAGLAANLTLNPFEAVTTITVQIKSLLTGDQEFESAKTLAAFALAFVLFFFTLTLNVIAQQVVRRFKEQYD
jgi:phosphate transport system permease protein